MNDVLALIPARYASSRLPGKPLVEIAGKPMIQHVYERVSRATRVDRVVVATDDERIREAVAGFGGDVVMTSTDHISGTDRIAAAARTLPPARIIINIQGDEPLIDPAVIDTLAEALESTDCECATPIGRITSGRDLFDTNVVKVVVRRDYTPLYFSRSPIPCYRDLQPEEWVTAHPYYRHIGIYAYRPDALEKFVAASPAALEVCEQLEQLRMLDLGMGFFCVETDYTGHAVDTPEDVMKVERIMESR
jgi:3-deoxy-manno-octulosonate cytidylyltransferase (CMP-KDO synthetase)